MEEEVRADPETKSEEDELGGSSVNMPEPQKPGKRAQSRPIRTVLIN